MVFDYHMRDFTGNYKLLFAKVVTLNFHAASAHLQGRHIISTVCNVLQVSPSVAVFFFWAMCNYALYVHISVNEKRENVLTDAEWVNRGL